MSCPPHIDWARRCVALDDSHSTPCLLRATRSGRKVTFESWVQHHGTPPDEKAPIVAASPVRDCFARWVDVPLTPLRKGLRVLASALDVVLPFPIESCSYHVLCAMETPEGKTRALTVGAREEALYARLGTLATAGTPPLVLDHEGVALWTQGVVEHPPQEESLRGIVHLADQRAVLTIGRGQDLIATYALRPLAPATLNRLLNATLVDMPELKDATIEWLWVGPLSGDPSTLAPLQAAAEEGGKAAHLNNEAPETFLARGLATRALLPGPMRCNLLQGELEPVAFAKRKRRRSLARALGALMACLVAIGAAAASRWMVSQHESAQEAQLNALAEALTGRRVPGKGEARLLVISREVARQRETTAPLEAFLKRPRSSDVADLVQTAGDDGLTIDTLHWNDSMLKVTGHGPEWNSAVELSATAGRLGYQVVLKRDDAGEEGRVPFALATEEQP